MAHFTQNSAQQTHLGVAQLCSVCTHTCTRTHVRVRAMLQCTRRVDITPTVVCFSSVATSGVRDSDRGAIGRQLVTSRVASITPRISSGAGGRPAQRQQGGVLDVCALQPCEERMAGFLNLLEDHSVHQLTAEDAKLSTKTPQTALSSRRAALNDLAALGVNTADHHEEMTRASAGGTATSGRRLASAHERELDIRRQDKKHGTSVPCANVMTTL